MRSVVIFGGSSAIAHAVARNFAKAKDHLVLVGRSQDKLDEVTKDLIVFGAERVETIVCDLQDIDSFSGLVDKLRMKVPKIDVLIMAQGYLGDQLKAQKDWAHASTLLTTNFLCFAALLTPFANIFEEQGNGTIAVISSVAGDRGRASNYVYGAAKAGLTAWLSGLRARLVEKGVHVLTIQPGFVATPMTAHLKKGLLMAEPGPVGDQIYAAIESKKDVIYVPGFWRLIMFIVRHIPERIFKHLKF